MKTYTKRILTWLMVIAMLTGIILTDYRAPVFSRAEEATATQANTDGTSASSPTEAGEQTGPQTEGAQEQTSPDTTTQGAETQAGEQGAANAPANQTVQEPQDITKHVTYTLEKFYVKEYNTETKKWERKYIINNGEKVNNPPAIYQNSGVGLEWSWEISEEGIESITKGSYFKIPVPTDNIISSNHEFSFYDPNGTEAGVFQVKDGFLTATFGDYKAAAGNDKLKDGIFKIEASMNKIIEKLTIPITNKEVSEKTVDISVVPRPKPDYDGPKPDQFTEQTWFPSFSKGGGQGEWQRNNDKIQYTFYINYQAIKDKFEEKNTKIKKKVIVEDKIPDKLSLELQDIEIYTPLFYPTYNTNGTLNKKPSNAKRINALLYKSTISPVNRNFEAIVGPTESYKTEESFENAVKNATNPTVGVWNKQYLLINFGNIPETLKYSSASTLINNKWGNTIEQRIEDDLRKNLITKEQADKAKELYAESLPVPAYNVTFTVGIKDLKQTTFTNKAVLTSEGEKAIESTKEVQTVIGEGKFNFDKALVNIEVIKKWFGKKQDKIKVELIKEGESTGKKIELSSSNNWTGYFNDLKKYHKKKEIKYTVKEESIPNYKVEVGEPIESDDSNKSIQITNIELTNISVEKVWNVPEGGQLPASVQVNLLKKGSNDIIETLTLKKGNNGKWTGVFKNVPKYDESNKEIEYIVKEVAVSGYKSAVTGDMNIGFTITNTKEKMNIPVEKIWKNVPEGESRPEVTVELWANEQKTDKTLTLKKENGWKGIFENLDINKNDKPINYSVKERSVKGYTTSIAPKAQDDITKGFVITNTKIPDITITVDKKWLNKKGEDISKKYKKLPNSITVELQKKSTNEVLDTKNLTKREGWQTSFEPVPSTDEKGNVIQYEVKEKTELSGFKVKQNPVAVNHNKAVLVNEKEEKFINISVEKKWLDEKGAVKSTGLPEKIVVQIIAKNDQGAVLNNYNRVVELYQNQSWKGSIAVPAETEEGDIIHYSAKEITVLGYLDGIIKHVKEANGNYSFTVTNKEIPKTEIKVKKKWTNENGGVLPDNHKRLLEVSSITVRLIKDGTPTNLTKELKKTDGWETSFTDLPKMKADGTEIVYSVKEIVEPNGFSAVTNPVKAVNGTATITNKLKPNKTNITVTKKWVGINGGQPEVTLKLVQSINGGAFTDVPNKSIKLPHNGNWNYTFNNLPSEDEFGNEIKYEVREDNIPSGYSRSYDHANYIVTNTKIDKINIEVTKQWLTDNGSTDLPDNYNLIPQQIEVELLANNAPMDPVKKIMLKKSESWTGKFIDLDKTDNQGRLIKYTVKETAKQNHFDLAAVADVDDRHNAIIKNIQTKENTTVKITKEWKDKSGNIVAGNIANKVKFELYYDDNGKKITVKNDIVLPTAEGKWEYIQSGLTKYDREGNLIKYQVEEIEVPEGYFKSIKHDNNFNFTATNQEIPKININVEKRWVDKDGEKLPDEYKLIPGSLEIKLLANNEAVTYNGQNTVKVLKSNNWKYEFKDLYEFDENGDPIKYSVQEILTAKDAKSFVAENPTVQVNNKEALLINKKSDEKVNVSVEKKWKDVSDSDITANLPSKVILKLVKVVNSKDEFIQEIALPVNGEWKAVIPNLAKYDSRGERIIYKVVEEDVPDGYFVEYGTPTVGENSTSFLVTNRVIPKVDIAVEKEWVNKDGVVLSKDNAQIPDSIRVKLLAGGKATGNIIELKKSEDWKGGFTNLDKKDKSGGDIVYRIEEIMPEKLNETFVVSSKTEPTEVNGYKAVITNKNTDQKVKVKIQKVWTDENGIDITKSIPDNVKLKMEILKYDGKIDGHDAYSPVKQDIEISKATNWSFESELLPKLDKDGNKIEYYVREVEVPDGYRVDSKPIEDPENNTFTFTVTNQIIPKTKMDVEKRWLDKDKKPLDSTYIRIPEKITVRLLANGHPIDVLDILKANDWKGSFTDLPLTDMYHQNITYKVEEVNVPEGFVRSSTTDDNGTVVITNKDAGETVKINVRKIWLDINNNPISNANVLPQFVKFQLLADGVSKGSFYVYKDKGFVWSSENLEKYDAAGKEISYTIKELDGTYGYSLTSINKSSNGLEFTVTNTESPYTPPYIPPYTPFIPDEPVPTPPNIPTPPAPNVPIDELVIEDDEVVLAGNDEEDLDDPEITDEPEDEEITDDLPRSNKDVPKTADFFMSGFANPLAVSTVIMMGYGLKKLVAKKKKD